MKLFRDYTFHWWQISLLKIICVAFGILIGMTWHSFFEKSSGIVIALWMLVIIPSIYLLFVVFKKTKQQQ